MSNDIRLRLSQIFERINLMKKALKIILPVFLFCAFAGSAYASDTKINAGILPSVWYSTTNPSAGDNIEIYGGIQNHSEFTLSLEAVFYVDGIQSSIISFTSNPKTLIEISGPWTAANGSHSIQIKIEKASSQSSSTISTDSLLSSESDKETLSVSNPITLQDIKDTVLNLATSTVNSIDIAANNLADKIESYKEPVSDASSASQNVSSDAQGTDKLSVSGSPAKVSASKQNLSSKSNTGGVASVLSAVKNSNIFKTIFNSIMDFLALAARHWALSLSAIVVLFVLIKFMIV